jgi:xylan 1,4-beta-xylosidase
LLLKIEANGDKYNFYYAVKKDKWILLKAGLDGKFLSTKGAGGFVGCLYAIYATSDGKPSDGTAHFNWFECRSDDEVYKK